MIQSATPRCLRVFVLTGMLLGFGLVLEGDAEPAPPNIILCMADDQGWGDVGYREGSVAVTPVLDEMAASGLRFGRFYTASSVCSPTRASVMTGRHPNRMACFNWGYRIRPEEVTVAEALNAAGYTTGHFGKWHLGSVRAGDPTSPGANGFDEWVSAPNFYDNDPLLSHRGTVIETKGESSWVTVEVALPFLRAAAEREQPFLAVIWFGSPHNPHEATPETREPYADLPEPLQHYYGEITGIDRALGLLRQELRDLDIAEDTLLWYTSDNGPQGPDENRPGSSGGLRGRKASLWEGGIRVPTIIEWPNRIPEPRVTDVPCGTVDIYPTLLDLAGVNVPNQPEPIDGISLVPLIDGELDERPRPLGFWDYFFRGRRTPSAEILETMRREQITGQAERSPFEDEDPTPEAIEALLAADVLPGIAAWLDGDFKLIRRPRQDGSIDYELYNLDADPAETTDLADQHPERVERMKAELSAWQDSVVRSMKENDYQTND